MLKALIISFTLVVFTSSYTGVQNKQTSPKTKPCGATPALNKKILNYVDANMGKIIGRGECWDVVAGALNSSGAKWDKKFGFGKEVSYTTDCVFPGDIIQLNDALVLDVSQKGLKVYDEFPQHSAIIIEVKNKMEYVLADQNFGFQKKNLSKHTLSLKNLTRGTVKIYRPVKE
jgi:hypothetical protein